MDSLRDEYCFHLSNAFSESVSVLDGLFDGVPTAGSWFEWIAPEGDQLGNDAQIGSLKKEIARYQKSLKGHIEFIENNSTLPPKYENCIRFRPDDGYALFLRNLQREGIDTKPYPDIRRSRNCQYWTIGFARRVGTLLSRLKNRLLRLERMRQGTEDETFLYEFSSDVRTNWDSTTTGLAEGPTAASDSERISVSRSYTAGLLIRL